MINVPENYKHHAWTDKRFVYLIQLINEVESKLECPNCERKEDAIRILKEFQGKLIMFGFLDF